MNKRNGQKKGTQKYLKFIALVAIYCAMLALTTNAQTVAAAVKPGSSTGSYALSGFETINPYSGNLNFSLPLLDIGGRGATNSRVKLTINQKWNVGYWLWPSNPQDPYRNFYAQDYFNESDNPAFDNGYSPGTLFVSHIGIYGQGENYCPYGAGTYLYTATLSQVAFIAPDGTEYKFRDRTSNGQIHNIGTCQFNEPSRGTIFDAMDGSSATFISDYEIKDRIYEGSASSAPGYSGYVFLPNGTQYRIELDKVVWQRDRNGNKITYTYLNSGPYFGNISKITDSLNREVTFEYGVQDVEPYGLCDRITYKGFGGGEKVIRISYKNLSDLLRTGFSIQTRGQLFPDVYAFSGCYPNFPEKCSSHVTNPRKQSAVWLPDGRSYKFQYNSYAELAKVELPTGGAIEYDWTNGFSVGSGIINGVIAPWNNDRFDIYRRVVERRVYDDGINLTNRLSIGGTESLGNNKGYVIEDLFDSTNSLLSRTKHFYHGIDGTGSYTVASEFYESWMNGREYQADSYDIDGSTLLRRTTSTWTQSSPSWFTGSAADAPVNNPRVTETTTLLPESNQISKRTFSYDSNNNLTDTYEYDYGIGAPGSFLRRTHTDYLTTNPVNNINYTSDSIHILGLPSQTWVSSDINGNNKVSLSKYEYDSYASDAPHAPLMDRFNISGHDPTFGTNHMPRGNLTKVTSYADAQNQTGAVSAYSQYDIAGNLVKAIDAKGNETTISYDDNFGSPDAEARINNPPSQLNGQQTFAYVTSVTNTFGHTGYVQFDYFTGAGVDKEDLNGNVNTAFYNDILDRPTQTISANNRPQFRRQSSIVYDDVNRKTTVTSDSKAYNDNLIKAESFYDKMGRTTETRQYETGSEYIVSLVEYDSLGRAYRSSTPFRPQLNEQPEWTETKFDSLGRVTEIRTPDNAKVTRQYFGVNVHVYDQAMRVRSGSTDAFGRLIKVVEHDTGVNHETHYTYDVLGRLRKTTQSEGQTTQNRYFMYNDLGHLIRAKQTEQAANPNLNLTDPVTGNNGWSVKYDYDANGNMISTTDANNRTITGAYDNLNRLTFRDYSDSTPDVTFTYDDVQIPNSKGQLTAVTSSVSSTFYTAFDELGRVRSSRQSTNGIDYNFPDYTYDFAGALVSQTYPSGRVVGIETDDIGRLSKVTSQVPNQIERTYLSNIAYTSFGAVKHARLGNGKWESAEFDSKRLQTKALMLGGSAGDASLLKIEYDFGTTDNNGSLRQQKITVPGAANPIVQAYTYDALNRLKTATETVNSQVSWKQTFQYDRFGNRRFDANNTTTLPQNDGVYNPQIDPATNKFLFSEGYNYDSDGNLLSNPESQLFTYDAENRQTQVENTASQTTANYYYDGTGKRVRKIVGQEETVFVYDAFGKLVAEYSTEVSQDPRISYLTTDDLGSPRIVTDQFGQVAARHDYLPFGEEVMAGVGGRTTAQGYDGDDGVRQQFTGYERDDESGLDYAQARYFKGGHGRFTSVDPLPASANIKNPQTFNRYSYALNSPYKFTDPLGLQPMCQGPGGGNNSMMSCDGAEGNGGDECNPKKQRCPVKPPAILETGLIVVDEDEGGSVTVTIGDTWSVPKVKGKSWWEHALSWFGFDTGTGTPAPPTTIPVPTEPGTDPSAGTPDAPSDGVPDGGGGDSAEAISIRIALLAIQFKVKQYLENKENPCPCLIRHGDDNENKLREDAERAQANGFPYGVSTKRVERLSGTDRRSRWAPLKAVQDAFPGTRQTGRKPDHYTVVFSSPVNERVTKNFNSIFTRR